jgi:hypothetical protein
VSKIYLDKVEFYITNVCNLTCENCNRFNNYYFKGWQDWQQYKEVYEQWADLLEIKHIVIMGGEPLLNPSICSWITGLLKFSPAWPLQILSNGTRINHVSGLYNTLKSNPAWIGVTLHNPDEMQSIMDEVEQFLQAPVTKLTGAENNPFNAPICFKDRNGVMIPFWITDEFLQSAILKDANGQLTLHNSDPVSAHTICNFAQGKSYHFIKGKLYKCGPVALLPEFDQQFGLKLSEEDRNLLNSYQPLTIDNFDSYHEEFFSNLDNPIPQCKFCPSYGGGGKIWPVRKGSVTN